MTTVRIRIPVWLDMICSLPVLLYRFFRYGYTFRRIYLGDDTWALVSPQDYCQLAGYNWYLAGNGKQFYAFRNEKIGPGKTKMVSMHREIMKAPKGLIVDHKNGNSLDNRRPNLRLGTQSQNMQNRAKKKGTTSRFVGVCYDKRDRKWIARIRTDGKVKCLGSHSNEIEAAKAYDAAAKKYHGEFAKLNFNH